MSIGNPALYVRLNGYDIPAVAVKPIEDDEFRSLNDIRMLVAKQNLPIAVLTPKAWKKLEGLYNA